MVGNYDINDSFDEDADGMLTVLEGHQVPIEQIYYLSPHHGDPPDVVPTVDDHLQRTTLSNIENAVDVLIPQSILASGRTCDEFLFFISTHGEREFDPISGNPTSVLQVLVEDDDHNGTISPATLNDWLCGIPCQKITVVIEACNSGGFLPELASCPDPVDPSQPTQKRYVFTSTSEMGESRRDDDDEDDTNPGDVGSETIGGYIEAFGSSAADLVFPKGEISFDEAVKYAIDNDASIPNRNNSPQVYPERPLRHDLVYPAAHWCYSEPGKTDLAVSSDLDLDSALTLASLVPEYHPRWSVVGNEGGASLTVGTLRYFTFDPQYFNSLTNRSFDLQGFQQGYQRLRSMIEWPTDFVQVGNTRLIQGLSSGETVSFVMPKIRLGPFSGIAFVPFLVVVDSPQDPLPMAATKLENLAKNNNVGVTSEAQ